MAPDRLGAAAASLALAGLAAACGGPSIDGVPTCRAEVGSFEIRIAGRGELKAARSTGIDVPRQLRGIQRIAWLAPEGSVVREGEVLARLDGVAVGREIEQIENQLRKLETDLRAKQLELDKERVNLDGELALLEQERRNAERFAPRDERLYSRHEILDAEINLELIESKIEHFRSRAERYIERAAAELEILQLQRRTEQVKLEQRREALANLELRAPHDGFLLHGRTWQGDKLGEGASVWPGMTIGELPDVSEMEAKVFVLESEAAGLADGLEAVVALEAHPGTGYAARVKSVQPVANAMDRESPVKYFETVLALERTDPERMRPGSEVRATIFVARDEQALSVPNQTIFHEGDATWVWIARRGSFEKAPVRLGRRSISRTVIEQGVEPGAVVAMVDPNGAGSR